MKIPEEELVISSREKIQKQKDGRPNPYSCSDMPDSSFL